MTKATRIKIYKKALTEYELNGLSEIEYSMYVCIRLATIGRDFKKGEYLETFRYFPEFYVMHPEKLFRDGTNKWWNSKDVESRKNALAMAIALAELDIPLS